MKYYPLFADLNNRCVVVVGGGEVATRKTDMLLKAGARVRVIAQHLHAELQMLVDNKQIKWIAENYHAKWLDGAFLVIAGTDDNALNAQVFADAEAQSTLVNVVDNQPLCSFIVPAVIDRSPIQIAISSAGTAPVLARLLRQKLEAEIPQHIGKFAALAGRFRDRVKYQLKTLTKRRHFWENLFADNAINHALANNQDAHAEQQLIDKLNDYQAHQGEVTLVGAGPGNADLFTLGGLQAVQAADVVLYDALVSNDVLNLVRRDAEKIYVGKRAQNHHVAQEKTNDLLLKYAKAGKRVVRLKGGDPFIFGRGGEECQLLAQHGINFRIIPGITAAAGATAYAGIPLTHRDYAQSAVFITGNLKTPSSDKNSNPIDWQALALSHQTVVIYMGTLKASEIAIQLQAHGRDKNTPVAVISNGTRNNQSTQVGQLSELPTLAKDAPRPALIVIGEVVSLREEIAWFGEATNEIIIDELVNDTPKSQKERLSA